eukprot:symbB.v1.2.024986.t2/scaffold2394.1/size82379/2
MEHSREFRAAESRVLLESPKRPFEADGSQDSAAECLRLQYALQKMKAMMREERSRWHEERMELMQELAQTKQALSEALAVDPSLCRSPSSAIQPPGNGHLVEISVLKDNVRAALDAMSAAAPLQNQRNRATCGC